MVLVDTSVWIHFFRNDNPIVVKEFERLLENDEVAICPILIQEILQGIRSDSQFDHVQNLLLSLTCLLSDSVKASIGAATLYRNLRKRGKTIRKSYDCLIAWYCIQNKIPVFSIDRDFEMIAEKSGLKLHIPI